MTGRGSSSLPRLPTRPTLDDHGILTRPWSHLMVAETQFEPSRVTCKPSLPPKLKHAQIRSMILFETQTPSYGHSTLLDHFSSSGQEDVKHAQNDTWLAQATRPCDVPMYETRYLCS